MSKILVIEDEPALMEDLVAILRCANYDAEGVIGGERGLEIAREWQPDLILCDLMMSPIDGFEILRQIRAAPEIGGTPFVILTARGDRAAQREAMEIGADDYLVKPFSASELLAAVDARLRRYGAMLDASLQSRLASTKQQLARMVTHELRTPLISINTVLDLMTRQLPSLTQQELNQMVDAISTGSQRLTHRVEQLVYLTQIESGLLSQQSILENGVCVRLWDILLSATNLARRFAYNTPEGVWMDTQDRDPEATVLCNPPALKQAFAELIANALKFSPPNTGVQVNEWSSKGVVHITITDQGNGIPPDKVEAALRPFEQIERDRMEQQGIGLGLPLAAKIIHAHGGELEIKGMIGHGTIVTIGLPVTPCP